MTHRNRIAIVLGLLATASAALAADPSHQVAVIVAPSCAMRGTTLFDLRRFFELKRTKAYDETPLTILMREPGPERRTLLGVVLRKSETDYNHYMLQATFTGAVLAAPRQIASAEATKHYVATNPGAVGYILASELDPSVRALVIDGAPAGSDAYPLVVVGN